ncbi:hypothetical protein [Bdellovibrio svalbardensis]|uniref:Secreted protein n=1 Tax=Bdellovibrio svalbardensis TaxID=2972972 RepID=A0ABT6DLM2_9BACT|nr:hypothetical protein [Bdellovibrio svalbardensis]MDG0816033.1 hypothetical protein [Bdellovibrio svalbardensis]
MKKVMKFVLSAAVLTSAIPKQVFAAEATGEVSLDQVIAQKKQQNEQARLQLINLKLQLLEMHQELEQEKNRFGYQASKWTRNIALATAGFASVATVVNARTGTNRNFIGYSLIALASGLVAGLGEVGVILTNDQVVELNEKIIELRKKVDAAEANLAAAGV